MKHLKLFVTASMLMFCMFVHSFAQDEGDERQPPGIEWQACCNDDDVLIQAYRDMVYDAFAAIQDYQVQLEKCNGFYHASLNDYGDKRRHPGVTARKSAASFHPQFTSNKLFHLTADSVNSTANTVANEIDSLTNVIEQLTRTAPPKGSPFQSWLTWVFGAVTLIIGLVIGLKKKYGKKPSG